MSTPGAGAVDTNFASLLCSGKENGCEDKPRLIPHTLLETHTRHGIQAGLLSRGTHDPQLFCLFHSHHAPIRLFSIKRSVEGALALATLSPVPRPRHVGRTHLKYVCKRSLKT